MEILHGDLVGELEVEEVFCEGGGLHAAHGLQADFAAVDRGRGAVFVFQGRVGGFAAFGDGDAEDGEAEGGVDGGAGAVEVFLEFALGGGDGSGGEVSNGCIRKGEGDWAEQAYGLCPACPAAPMRRERSCPVKKPSSGSNSQPSFSVADSTRRRVNVLRPVEMASLEAKTDRTAEMEAMSCDHTLWQVSIALTSK